jgi:membrane fusion protein (multidrug efflux system)
VRLLVNKKVISKTELEVAHTKLNAARARIEEARSAEANAAIRLSYAHVKAPFDGIIDRIPLKTGSLVEQGTLLTCVSDNRAVFTYFPRPATWRPSTRTSGPCCRPTRRW